jgi:hypothetical protein
MNEICICGHVLDSHWGDPEMTAKLPCQDGDYDGKACPCTDYIDKDDPGQFVQIMPDMEGLD